MCYFFVSALPLSHVLFRCFKKLALIEGRLSPTPPRPLQPIGNYRLSGVEVRRCGQSGVLGRYCTHFHMMGTRPDSYLTDSSVHRSYQRVVSVHASNDVLVRNVVGYDIRSHAFFVEDGAWRGSVVCIRCAMRWHEESAPVLPCVSCVHVVHVLCACRFCWRRCGGAVCV